MHKTSRLVSVLVAAVALLFAAVCAAQEKGGRIELPDATGLKVGDRIHVHRAQIEPDDSDTRWTPAMASRRAFLVLNQSRQPAQARIGNALGFQAAGGLSEIVRARSIVTRGA